MGKYVVSFPFRVGFSNVLKEKAMKLFMKWREFSERFDIACSVCNIKIFDIELLLCFHYQSIASLLETYSEGNNVCVHQHVCHKFVHENIISKMIGSLNKLRPFLLSYWFHGSIGSNDVTSDWSDVDGLAIVSIDTFSSPDKLRQLRIGLIQSRSYMLDFMPYQLHGHFILAEPDLISFPSCMFPTVLFENAQCAIATSANLSLCERFDRRMALEMLWKHGVADLLETSDFKLENTLSRIAFLHRIFLFPCLVFQVYNKPCFKKDAFERLSELFLPEEIIIFQQASTIWSIWQSPPPYAKMAFHIAWPFRFNSLLYQAMTHKIGKKLPWFSNVPPVKWPTLMEEMRTIVEKVWQRILNDIRDV